MIILERENGEIVYFFSAQESQPVYATNYFYINPTTGDITLTANLRRDPNTTQYQVCLWAHTNQNCINFSRVWNVHMFGLIFSCMF